MTATTVAVRIIAPIIHVSIAPISGRTDRYIVVREKPSGQYAKPTAIPAFELGGLQQRGGVLPVFNTDNSHPHSNLPTQW